MVDPKWRALTAITVAILLVGCSSTSQSTDTPCDLYLNASSRVNPDSNARPAPILVGIYGLKSTAAFEAGGFSALQDNAKTTLGDDLVSFEQVILLPGEHRLIQRTASAQTRALGIVAGYRELNGSVWKTTLALPARDGTSIFSFRPFSPEQLTVRVKLNENGLAVEALDRTH
ncbi:type VI secretion system lipoprotein TssJ [Paraburkholderia sp. BCC1884]|uniref:type VI secretion system lipoprotein TssJ n=1 Tax=Paraburkholderia sp. BCC1884 TaxID=2562668 RepID=UPI001182DA1C|nr:type VI secretion system lipoprotein TssJ [Paraburkholderia sp. BCC1884]